MNHALRPRGLKRIHQRRQITNIAAQHRQILAGHPSDIIRPRREIEKCHLIAAID